MNKEDRFMDFLDVFKKYPFDKAFIREIKKKIKELFKILNIAIANKYIKRSRGRINNFPIIQEKKKDIYNDASAVARRTHKKSYIRIREKVWKEYNEFEKYRTLIHLILHLLKVKYKRKWLYTRSLDYLSVYILKLIKPKLYSTYLEKDKKAIKQLIKDLKKTYPYKKSFFKIRRTREDLKFFQDFQKGKYHSLNEIIDISFDIFKKLKITPERFPHFNISKGGHTLRYGKNKKGEGNVAIVNYIAWDNLSLPYKRVFILNIFDCFFPLFEDFTFNTYIIALFELYKEIWGEDKYFRVLIETIDKKVNRTFDLEYNIRKNRMLTITLGNGFYDLSQIQFPKQKEKLIKAKETFGTTDKCLISSFILPNGKVLDLRDRDGYHQEHSAIKKIYPNKTQYEAPTEFLFDAPALSLYSFKTQNSFGLDIPNSKRLTKKQWEKLEECICYEKPKKEKTISVDIYEKKHRKYESISYSLSCPEDCFDLIKLLRKKIRKLQKKTQDQKRKKGIKRNKKIIG
jgi:hypothetical protein